MPDRSRRLSTVWPSWSKRTDSDPTGLKVFVYEPVSAGQSEARQHRAAAVLAAAGCGPGDRVALVAHNAPDVLAWAIGALRVGVVPVMVNPDLLPAEREVILEDCEPMLIVTDDGVSPLLDAADLHAWSGSLADVPLARPMHYTSGTTGRPKGVWSGVLGEEAAAALLAEERELWGFRPEDRNLVCSPMYHSAPLRFATGSLMAGGSVVVLR